MEVRVGRISHYWSHLGVAGIELSAKLKVGDKIHIKGHTTDLEQPVQSIQIEHAQVNEADAGASVGIRVLDHVREHDDVFVVTPEESAGPS